MTLTAPPRPPLPPRADPEALIAEARQRARRRRRIYAIVAAAVLALLVTSLIVVFGRPEPPQSLSPEPPRTLPIPPDHDDAATIVAKYGKFHVGWVVVYGDGRVIQMRDMAFELFERHLTPRASTSFAPEPSSRWHSCRCKTGCGTAHPTASRSHETRRKCGRMLRSSRTCPPGMRPVWGPRAPRRVRYPTGPGNRHSEPTSGRGSAAAARQGITDVRQRPFLPVRSGSPRSLGRYIPPGSSRRMLRGEHRGGYRPLQDPSPCRLRLRVGDWGS